MSYKLPKDFLGYKKGTELRDVTLKEARSWDCNHCGGCCNGMLPDDIVTKDEDTGLPKFVWGSKFPEDLYASRYGEPMLQPIVFMEEFKELPYQGEIGIGDEFMKDADGKPYTCFKCAFYRPPEEAPEDAHYGGCKLFDIAEDPKDLATLRPLNCGEFPIFSTAVDDALVGGNTYIPATGNLPSCTWYGIRIVGPWREDAYWRHRWNKQRRGEAVPDKSLPKEWVMNLEEKARLKREGRANTRKVP